MKVRCSVCSGIFFVDEPEVPLAPPPPAPEPAVASPEAHQEAPGQQRPPRETEVDDDRDHLDPWSGAGFDDQAAMGDSDLGDEGADPWSGGVDLAGETHEVERSEEVEEVDGGEMQEPAAPEESAAAESWVVERSRPADIHEPDEGVERMETVEEQMRAAAADMTPDQPAAETSDDPWDEETVPPAAEAPVEATGEAHATTDRPEGTETPSWVEDAVEAPAETSWEEDAVQAPQEEDAVQAGQGEDAAESPVETSWEEESDEIPQAEDAAESPVEASWEEAAATADEASEPEVEPQQDAAPAAPAGFQFGKRDPHEKARRLARVLVSDMITYNPERHERALEQGTLHADFEEEIRKSWAEYTEQVGQELAESTTYWFDALNEILARGERIF